MTDRHAQRTHRRSRTCFLLVALMLACGALPRASQASRLPRPRFAAKALMCTGETTVRDFAGGTHLGTAVGERDHGPAGGQVRLQARTEDLFTAPELGALWQVTQPAGGFAPVIADGVLDVQERDDAVWQTSALETAAAFEAGVVLEMRALFNPGSAFSTLGFVTSTVTATQWLTFSTRGSGDGLVPILNTSVRGVGGAIVSVPTNVSLGQWHDFRIVWLPDSVAFYVDDELVDARTGVAIDQPQRVGMLKSGGSDSALLVDWVRVTDLVDAEGAYTSQVLDAGSPAAAWTGLQWQGAEPDGTSVAFATRSGDTALPDSTWSAWDAVVGGSPASPAGRYAQYRATLATTSPGAGPVLDAVQLCYAVLDAAAPTVVAAMPPDASGGIIGGTTVAATFAEALDPATVSAATFTVAAGGGPALAAAVSYDPVTFTATLVPDAPLAADTLHEARLGAAIADLDGNPLGVDLVWTFTTAPPDLLPPRVEVKRPAPGAVDVLASQPVSVTFSEPLDPATLTGASFTLAPQGGPPVAASVSYDPATRTATLRPAAHLADAATYEVRLDASVADLAGLDLGRTVVWGFTTRLVSPVCAVATSLADFGSGLHAGTMASESDSSAAGGQLRLLAPLSEVFADSLLPASWHVTRPAEGAYRPVITGGVLDVQEHDGLDQQTSALEAYQVWGPGVVMEARAMFVPGSRFIDVGLDASTINNGQYAWFSTAGTGDQPGFERITCRVREYDHTTVAIDTDATFDEWHVFRIEWTPGRVDFYVDGALVATHTGVLITSPMRPALYKSDDSQTPFLVDWVRVMPYADQAGTWTSPVVDAGTAGTVWTDLDWQGSVPAGGSVAFATRTGESAAPDSTWSAWQGLDGLLVTSPPGRYAQYRAALATGDALDSPVLDEVRLCYDPEAAGDHLTVQSMDPAAATMDVPAAAAVHVVFSRPLDPGTLGGGGFTLASQAGDAVAAALDYDPPTRTATLTPLAPLDRGVVYVTRLATSIADTAGLPLAAAYQWSFTTAPPVSAVGPDLPGTPTELLPNVPNPFNPATTIAFNLARGGQVRLRIYSVDGRLVRTLADGARPAGTHSLVWTGTDDQGRSLPTGVYLARLETPGAVQTRKMMLLK